MGETTYGACDIYNSDYNAKPLASRPQAGVHFNGTTRVELYAKRMATLAKFAVYYSACAMIYVLKKAGMDKRSDTTSGRVNTGLQSIYVSQLTAVRHKVPEFAQLIDDVHAQTHGQKSSSVKVSSMNLMLAACIFIPLLAMVVVPSVAKEVLQPKVVPATAGVG